MTKYKVYRRQNIYIYEKFIINDVHFIKRERKYLHVYILSSLYNNNNNDNNKFVTCNVSPTRLPELNRIHLTRGLE